MDATHQTLDTGSVQLLEDALTAAMAAGSGSALDAALTELGWFDMLTEAADVAVPLLFRLLGQTGAHAPVLNDVVLHAAGRDPGGTVPLPFAGGCWIVWERTDRAGSALGGDLPLHRVPGGDEVPLAAGRVAAGWWLAGAARAMLALARRHALDRQQFGRPVASFQAVRHRLADTLVAIEGAEAALGTALAEPGELSALLAKAAAGRAALTAARHCQQVLGGIGFTAEHELHRHVERALVLDGVLGSTRELTRAAGTALRRAGSTPRLGQLTNGEAG